LNQEARKPIMKLKVLVLSSIVAVGGVVLAPIAGASGPIGAGPDAPKSDLTVNSNGVDFDSGSAPAVSDFTAVTLNGSPQLTSAQIDPFGIADMQGAPSGSGGWNVTIAATNLSDGTHTIDAGNLTMVAPSVIGAFGADASTIAVNPVAYDDLHAAGTIKIADAPNTQAGGTYLVSPGPLKLYVPQDAVATAVGPPAVPYQTTVTIAVTAGP
jgi:hypothetical protein